LQESQYLFWNWVSTIIFLTISPGLSTMAATATHPITRAPQSEKFEVISATQANEPEKVDTAPEDHPTDSHELSNADHEEKGAAQIDHGQIEVRDLGWNEEPADVAQLVGGLPNDELWTLIRRFNKVQSIRSAIYNELTF
jgi:hypothetical protein